MKIFGIDVANHLVAPLIVAAICSGAIAVGQFIGAKRVQDRIDAAPKKYVEALDTLIQRAVLEGPENAAINARAIVSARNSLRSALVTISSQLNSEIDHLAVDLGDTIAVPLPPSNKGTPPKPIDPQQAYQTIEVLARVWPAKRVQIEVEVRKALTELGVTPSSSP